MFIDGFDDHDDVFTSWNNVDPTGKTIIFAVYEREAYEGNAMAIFSENDTIYMVEDSHCSCRGLEWWEPDAMPLPVLKKMVEESSYGILDRYRDVLTEIITDIEEIGVEQYVVLTRLNM